MSDEMYFVLAMIFNYFKPVMLIIAAIYCLWYAGESFACGVVVTTETIINCAGCL